MVTKPIKLFGEWLGAAREEEDLAAAVALATADEQGRPSVRMVMLMAADERGFSFYTNMESRKGGELIANPFASMCFYWKSQKRQIRVDGSIEPVNDEEADAYFDSRPKDFQIGTWASRQSRLMKGMFEFEAGIARYAAKYAFGKVPRPPHWSGFRINPARIEFWEERKFRLHMRHAYEKDEKNIWQQKKLYP